MSKTRVELELVADSTQATAVVKKFTGDVVTKTEEMVTRANKAVKANPVELRVDADTAPATSAVSKLTGTVVDRVRSMATRSIAAVKGLEDRITKGLGGAISKVAGSIPSIAASIAKVTAGAVASIGAAAGGLGLSAVTQFSAFEAAMANVSTLVDTSKVNIDELKKSIMELPPELGSATGNANALYQALSAGVAPAQAIQFVADAAKAAKAGLTDTFTAVDAGTSVLNAFGMQSKDAGMIYDQMFKTVEQGKTTFEELAGSVGRISPIAAAASVSTSEMFAAIATLTKGGFATSEAVSRMSTALGAIISPTSEASKLAAQLGIDFSAAGLKSQGLAGFLTQIKDATNGDVEAMGQLFGGMESLSVMLALTGKQSGEFSSILDQIGASAGSVDAAFAKQQGTLAALWETFQNTIGKQAIFLGEQLAPVVKQTINDVSAWMKANQDLIKSGIIDFAGDLVEGVKSVTAGVRELLPFMRSLWDIAKLVGSAFNATGKAIAWVLSLPARNAIVSQSQNFVQDSYATGTDYVPKTGIYQLHQGEIVIPAQAAELIRNGDMRMGRDQLLPEKDSYAKGSAIPMVPQSDIGRSFIDSYASGTGPSGVPRTGTYLLHAGETVNKPLSRQAPAPAAQGSITFGDINIVLPPGTAPQSESDWRRTVRDTIIPELRRARFA